MTGAATLRAFLGLAAALLPSVAAAQISPRMGARPETIEAEQRLPSLGPAASDPIHLLGAFFKPLGATGRVPELYTPAAGATFEVPAQLLEEGKADVITAGRGLDPAIEQALYRRDGGRTLVRRLLHPLEAMRIPAAGALFDGARWSGTPTSSVRSLLISGPRGSAPLMAKTSLGYVVAGVDRRVGREHARLAVQVSAYYEDLARETAGRIPNTDKTWTFFAEPAAVGVKGEDSGYTLLRAPPADYSESVYLPFYALIARRPDGRRWIDELYEASGYGDKLEFAWHELAKPLLEFHLMVHLDHGVVTELHQQNALLRVDPATKKVLGISTRDMDGHSIDYAGRRALGLPVVAGGLTQDNSRAYGYLFALQMPMLGYEYFKDAIFKNVMKFFLEPGDVRRLVGLGNDMMVRRFNEKHAAAAGPARGVLDLTAAFQRLYDRVLPADEAAFFRAEARSYRESVHPLARLMKGLIFRYYRLKQRLERSQLPTRSAFADRKGVEPLLERIAAEAQGVVPADALAYWLALQRRAPSSFDERFELPGETRPSSARERRALAMGWARRGEQALRASGTAVKSRADFPDEGAVVGALFDYASPFWYTRRDLSRADFVRLLGLPLHVGGVRDRVESVDGYDMAPVEFLRHDELHSLSASAGLDRLLQERGIVKGSAAYYEYVLERLRLTKAFLGRSASMPAAARADAETLWFDAFHESFARRWPLHRYHENLAPSRENLRRYVDCFVDAKGRLRPLRRLQAALGLGVFAQLPAGRAQAAFACLSSLTQAQD